jgi:hypothetical protein
MKLQSRTQGILAVILFGFAMTTTVHAQTASDIMRPISIACTPITTNLSYGAYDASTAGGVTALQGLLVGQGLFPSASLGTGHFGPLTLGSVKVFQAAHGIPATGFVGPLTRAEITTLQQNCSVVTMPPSPVATSTVSLNSLSSTSARTGDTLTLTGTGFTGSNTVLFDGNVAERDVPINPTFAPSNTESITITIPSSLSPDCDPKMMCPMYVRLLTTGNYTVTVENSNGTSNSLPITITGTGNEMLLPQT